MAEGYVCPPEMEEMEPMRKMFVGNIAKDATEDELKEVFTPFGEVTSAKKITREGSQICFGFVTFATVEATDECLLSRTETPLKLKDRELQVKRAVPKDDQTQTAQLKSKKIFFARAVPETTEDQVREYLESRHPPRYGKIEKVELVKNKDGEGKGPHKGFGFVHCETEDLADRIAIAEKKAKIIPGSTKDQEFKKALPKDGAGMGGGRGGGRGGARGGFGQRGGRGGFAAGGYGGGYGAGGYGAGGYGGGAGYGGWGQQAWGGGYGGYGGGYGGY